MRRLLRLSPLALTLLVVPLWITGCSRPPEAVGDNYTVLPGDTLEVPAFRGVLANDIDAEGEPLTAILDQTAYHGTLDLRPDGSFTYTPRIPAGTDAFTYQAFDGVTRSAPVNVFLKVDAAPAAVPDSWVVEQPGPLSVPAPGILANDADPAGDPISAHIVTLPAHGTLRSFADGRFTYKPRASFEGVDSFTYEATDGGLASPVVAVTLYVTSTNRPPVGEPDTYTLYENSPLDPSPPGVLANDSDPDGHPIRAELLSAPGPVDSFDFRADGSFSLVPFLDWDSDLTFSYRVTDGSAFSAPVTVTIDMIAINNPPVGEDDNYELAADQTFVVDAPGVLANDSDPVEFDTVRVYDLFRSPTDGELDLREDGSFTYTPDPGFTGFDGFAYRPGDLGPGNVTNVSLSVG